MFAAEWRRACRLQLNKRRRNRGRKLPLGRRDQPGLLNPRPGILQGECPCPSRRILSARDASNCSDVKEKPRFQLAFWHFQNTARYLSSWQSSLPDGRADLTLQLYLDIPENATRRPPVPKRRAATFHMFQIRWKAAGSPSKNTAKLLDVHGARGWWLVLPVPL